MNVAQVDTDSGPAIPPTAVLGILCLLVAFGALFALMRWFRSRRHDTNH